MGVSFAKNLTREELLRLLDDIPTATRWDIVQLGLDLVGIVNPAADAASGFISLLRGDLLGAAISAVSIFPIGDVVKLARFSKYRKAVEAVVSLANRNVRVARALELPLKQIDQAVAGVQGLMGAQSASVVRKFLDDLASIRANIARYQLRMARIRLVDRYGVSRMARRYGKSGGQYAGSAGQKLALMSVNQVVDVLEKSKSLRNGTWTKSKEVLDMMALSGQWYVTAPIHRSIADGKQHITIMISGITGQFHLKVDKTGLLYDIKHLQLFK
jgi:hypothetical protein